MSDSKQQSAITVKDLHKTFKLPHEQPSGIKQFLVNMAKGKRGYETQHVLDNVSFEIKKGEFFGIIGRNGSGKSTLLKLLSGIYSPDTGSVSVNGSLTPFIELGVGFNPELTGRENVFLNGALLGFSRAEMLEMYDEIIEFAELERFMDQKLKNYSSGMQVRLAFSIAIRAKTDVLILDEVLAVGDALFQAKCLKVFREYKETEKTVVLVSHDSAVVQEYCDRVLVLHEGRAVFEGDTKEGISKYIELSQEAVSVNDNTKELAKSHNVKAVTFNSSKRTRVFFTGRDSVRIELSFAKSERIKNIGVAIFREDNVYCFAANTINEFKLEGSSVTFEFPTLELLEGTYSVAVGLFGKTDQETIAYVPNVCTFYVHTENLDQHGVSRLEYNWRK